MSRAAILIVLVLLVTGCAVFQPKEPLTAEWVTQNLSVSTGDPYRKTATTYRTPPRYWGSRYFRGHGAQLVHWGSSNYAMEVTVWADSWKFIENAATAQGQQLHVKVEDRLVGRQRQSNYSNSDITEKLQVTLSREFLLENKDGFSVKLWGKRGEVVVDMPWQYVQGFIAGIR